MCGKFCRWLTSFFNKDGEKRKSSVLVRYNVGMGNTFFIRGEGANLNWEKGIPLHNVGEDLWKWETDLSFQECKFKILINDQQYETGDNHTLSYGQNFTFTPNF